MSLPLGGCVDVTVRVYAVNEIAMFKTRDFWLLVNAKPY